jgi:uncharacterized protein DUF4259
MGVWGAGNFANDEALDYAHELADQMIEQIATTVASEHGMDPDEPDSFQLMCNIDFLWLIGRHAGLSMPEAAVVKNWKARYLATWDSCIDGLAPDPAFKQERRAVLVKSFDRLIKLCRNQAK